VASARVTYTLQDAILVRVGGLARLGGDRTQYGILPFRGMVLADVQAVF
jgi:hypothetical protein